MDEKMKYVTEDEIDARKQVQQVEFLHDRDAAWR